MKKWWVFWIFSVPIFIITYMNSFFITSKITYESQAECKTMFIFTPQNVHYCSEIYPIDIFLISLKTKPLSYICLISGIYLIGFIFYILIRLIMKSRENQINAR